MVAAESFSQGDLERIHKGGKDYYETIKKSHSQVEARRFYMTRARLGIAKSEEWRGLRNFICYEKQMYRTITGEETLLKPATTLPASMMSNYAPMPSVAIGAWKIS